jgi:hypothetical protein
VGQRDRLVLSQLDNLQMLPLPDPRKLMQTTLFA